MILMRMKNIILAGAITDWSLLSVVVAEVNRMGPFYDLHLVHCQCLRRHNFIVMRKMTSLTSVTTPAHDHKHVLALMLGWIFAHNLKLELIHGPVGSRECVLALGFAPVTSLLSVVNLECVLALGSVPVTSLLSVVNLECVVALGFVLVTSLLSVVSLGYELNLEFVVNLGLDQDNQRSVEGLCCAFQT